MSAQPYYAHELFPQGEAPAGFDRSLTTFGLFSLRRERDWKAIAANRSAAANLFNHIANFNGNDDGTVWRLKVEAIAKLAGSRER